MKIKNMLFLTISYVPWVVYWTISAQLLPYGGGVSLIIELCIIYFMQRKNSAYSFMDGLSAVYFSVTIIAHYVFHLNYFIVGDGYFGYGFLFMMSVLSICIKHPFMKYYVNKDLPNTVVDNSLLEGLAKTQTLIWMGVFFIDTWVFVGIQVPVIAIVTSNVFVVIGIILSLRNEKELVN